MDKVTELYSYHMNLIEAVRSFTGDKMAEEVADAIEESWWAAGLVMRGPSGGDFPDEPLSNAAKCAIAKRAFPALIGA